MSKIRTYAQAKLVNQISSLINNDQVNPGFITALDARLHDKHVYMAETLIKECPEFSGLEVDKVRELIREEASDLIIEPEFASF